MRSWRRGRIGIAGGGLVAFAAMLAGEVSPARAFDLSSLDVFNLFGSYAIGKYTLRAGVDNVFDKNYQLAADYSTGGATVFAGVRWQP